MKKLYGNEIEIVIVIFEAKILVLEKTCNYFDTQYFTSHFKIFHRVNNLHSLNKTFK
jgi:hypothetical protein